MEASTLTQSLEDWLILRNLHLIMHTGEVEWVDSKNLSTEDIKQAQLLDLLEMLS